MGQRPYQPRPCRDECHQRRHDDQRDDNAAGRMGPLSRGQRPTCCYLGAVREGSRWFEAGIHCGFFHSLVFCQLATFVLRGLPTRQSSNIVEADEGDMCERHHNAGSELSMPRHGCQLRSLRFRPLPDHSGTMPATIQVSVRPTTASLIVPRTVMAADPALPSSRSSQRQSGQHPRRLRGTVLESGKAGRGTASETVWPTVLAPSPIPSRPSGNRGQTPSDQLRRWRRMMIFAVMGMPRSVLSHEICRQTLRSKAAWRSHKVDVGQSEGSPRG